MERYCVGATMAVDWGDRSERAPTWRVLSYFAPYRVAGAVVVVLIAVDSALGLAPAVAFKSLIDVLSGPAPTLSGVTLWVGLGVAAAIASGLVGVGQSYLSTTISQGIVARLRRELFERLLDQPIGFFTRSRSGDILSRFSNDVNGVGDVVADTVFGLVRNALVTVATLGLMLVFSWPLTLLVLVLIPLVGWPMRRAGEATYQARTATQRQHGDLNAYLQEILGVSGVMLVKAFGTTARERYRFGLLNERLRRLEVREVMVTRWFAALMTGLEVGGPALIILAGGWLVIVGQATVGTVFVFATVLGARLAASVTDMASMHVNITGSLALFGRLFAYIDRAPEITDGAAELDGVRGAVRLARVTYAYPGGARPALDGVTADIPAGSLVALVGPSGAGKTTLTGLLPRFYDPQQGMVSIDSRDVRAVTLESLTRHIGVVFQDTFLFHASIADNLRYARPDATDDQIVAAARAAQLHEFIAGLPDGYDTIVGERGHRLSGGEKQRMAIARVILKDPEILILDEATSHLDTVSEQLIQAALRPLLAGRTSLVIAHRLSTILAADLILVLDQGRIVDRGTHAELLARGGLYATLYDRQFRAPSDEPDEALGSSKR